MPEQQNDVSPATAGGAFAPDPIGTIRDVNGKSFVLCDNPDFGRRWVPIVGAGQFVDGDFWRVSTRPVIGAAPGTPAARDPRDTEVERLRGEAHSREVTFGNFVCGIANALGGMSFSDTQELIDTVGLLRKDCADNAEEWKRADAEVTRLHGELAKEAAELTVIRHDVAVKLNRKPSENDGVPTIELIDDMAGRWRTAVTQLRRTEGDLTEARKDIDIVCAQRNQAQTERDESMGAHEEFAAFIRHKLTSIFSIANEDYDDLDDVLRIVAEYAAERDRLRQERDRASEQLKFEEGDRVRFGRYLGTVIDPWPSVRMRLDGTEILDYPTKFVHRLCNDKAGDRRCVLNPGHDGEWHDDGKACWAVAAKAVEPRRWVAGDPEPEVGTTVRQSGDWGAGPTWTRTSDGWHPNHACRHEHADQCSGLVFSEWEQLPRPLVEVVSTDGE